MATPKLTIPFSSRYNGTKVYQDPKTGSLYFSVWQPIDFPPRVDDTWYNLTNEYEGLRLDLVSYKVYQTTDFWWVIAQANNINNPFVDIYGYASYARSPLVFSPDFRQCFYAVSNNVGSMYNTDNYLGITFQTTATTLQVFKAGVLQETFNSLSPYPLTTDGLVDPDFWGNVNSNWIKIKWTSPNTLRPSISGVNAPVPVSGTFYMSGGTDITNIQLRCPSLLSITTALQNARNHPHVAFS